MYAGKYNPSPGQPDALTQPDPDQNGNYPYISDRQVAGRLDTPYSVQQQALDFEREKDRRTRDTQERVFGTRFPRAGSSSEARGSQDSELDFNPFGGGARRGGAGRSGGGSGGDFDVLEFLSGLAGGEGISGSGSASAGDVTSQWGDTLGPIIAAITSAYGTQSGERVAKGGQANTLELGREANANNRRQTEAQLAIAREANIESARAQAARDAEAERRALSNSSRHAELVAAARRNPLARTQSSGDLANSLMGRGSMPSMMIG